MLDGTTATAERSVPVQAPPPARQEAPGTSSGTPQPETPQGPKRREFVLGGEEQPVSFVNTAKPTIERILERKQIVDKLAQEGRPLSDIDRFIQTHGEKIVERINNETFTGQDAASIWFYLKLEYLEKSLAAGELAPKYEETSTLKERKLWLFPRSPIIEKSQQRIGQPIAKTDTTEYTRRVGFDKWTQAEQDRDLTDLRGLITNYTQEAFGINYTDFFIDDPDRFFFAFDEKTRFLLQNEIAEHLSGPNGILTTQYGGKDFITLLSQDGTRFDAINASYQATERALISSAGKLGKEILSGAKPRVDASVIKSQSDKLRQEPKPEEIDPVTNEQIMATQAKLEAFNKDLGEVEKEINELETSEAYAKEELAEEANKRLLFLQGRKDEVLKNQLSTKADLELLQPKLDEALRLHNAPEARIERQEKATAFDKWTSVTKPENYEKIIATRFSQTFEDPFTLERLASTREITLDGETQIEGAERIRQHIFWLIDKQGFDPELARKMLSDETIARAIVWNYKIDTAIKLDIGTPHEATFSSLLTHLQDNRDIIREIEAMKPSERRDSEREDLKKFKDTEKRLLKTTLPYLNSSQFQVGDLLRFMVHEGLKSAERGNPYLSLSEYYESPKPELKLEAESIYRDGIGEVAVKGNKIVWEGRLDKALDPLTFSNTIPQHYSVGLGIDRNLVNYNLDAKTDRDFLQLLPDTFHASLPDSVRVFYDGSGKLSTDKPGAPEWIRVYEGTSPTAEDTLNSLNGMISGEFSQLMTSSIADYFIKKSQQERLQMLRGFHTVENINDVPLAENPTDLHNYQIRLDNSGNFFIQDITNPALPEKHELSSFFQRRLEEFKGSKLTLNADERKTLQEEFLKILSPLGREILRAQQRR